MRLNECAALASNIPPTAATYLTNDQAIEVRDGAANETGITTNLLQFFKANYPRFAFCLDEADATPNAYAFDSGRIGTIVLTAGLIQLKGMADEGLSLILAHMMSAYQKLSPVGFNGWTSVAMADYCSISVFLNLCSPSKFEAIYHRGIKQLNDSLFQYIIKNQIYKDDPYKPSIATRFDAMEAAYAMAFPAGGIGRPAATELYPR